LKEAGQGSLEVGEHESTVRDWETGRHRPSRRHRERIEGIIANSGFASLVHSGTAHK